MGSYAASEIPEATVQRWRDQAAAGDVEAMFDLGMYHVHITGEWHDGQDWLEKASALGHDQAGFALADLYGEQDGQPWQRTGAVLAEIANRKSPEALFRLAEHYLIDRNQPEKSEPLMLQAAEAGHVHAMNLMASFFCRPRGDVQGERRWRARAAAHGNWLAHLRLAAFAFADGLGDLGRHHVSQALGINLPKALAALAEEEGEPAHAEDLWRAAALRGNSQAAAHLAILFRESGRVTEAAAMDALLATMHERARLGHAPKRARPVVQSEPELPWWRQGL